MIKHIVLWKLKENAEGKSKAENAAKLKKELEALASKIREIRKLEIGINSNTSQDAYDLGLVSEFATREDLDMYQKHPEHQRVAGLLRKLRDSRIVVDYEM